jgi:hypothetical protein
MYLGNLYQKYIFLCVGKRADPSGSAVLDVGLRSVACWESNVESRRGHGCLCLMTVVYCRVKASEPG